MALLTLQRRRYTDELSAYRTLAKETDELGDSAVGVRAVVGVQAQACMLHETDQFQARRAPGIRINQDNLETADSVFFEIALDIRENDWVKISRRKTGVVSWYRIAGAPRTNPEGNWAQCFLLKSNPPEIAG